MATVSTTTAYTPVTTAGQINFAGLGSGTDFSSIISKLVQVEQIRITNLQTWRQSWTDKQTAFQDLNTKMLALQTTLQGMDTMDEFLVKTSSSSDTTVISATAGSGAVNGVHQLTVGGIATAKNMITAIGYTSNTHIINNSGSAEKFVYTYKGVTYSNAVGTGASLTDLATIINQDPQNPGVKASILNSGTAYYLQFYGMDTGSNATLTISNATTVANFKAANFSTTQSNASAKLKLDGWPTASNAWITRQNNSITDLIPGLTLNVQGKGTTSISTITDTAAIVQNIQTFVAQVNTVRTDIQGITKVSTSGAGSILTGNYGIQIISSLLEDIIAAPGIGFDRNRDKLSVLAQVGITTDPVQGSATEGQLVVSSDVLNAVLASNADGVAKLFAARYTGSTDSSYLSFTSYIPNLTQAGTYSVNYATDASGKLTSASINGHPATLSSNSNAFTGAPGTPEAGMIIKAINLAPNQNISGHVYFKLGKTSELVNQLTTLTDSTNGPLAILKSNYTDITNDIDSKIAFEQQRISNMAQNLKLQYSKLDALLGNYSQQTQQLTSQVNQLGTSSSTSG